MGVRFLLGAFFSDDRDWLVGHGYWDGFHSLPSAAHVS